MTKKSFYERIVVTVLARDLQPARSCSLSRHPTVASGQNTGMVKTMYTTRYKLFRAPRLRNLKRQTDIARQIWNYFLGWQRLRHACGLPYMNVYEMAREFTTLRNAHPDIFADWRDVDSWAARDILKRLHRAYKRFFTYCKQRRKGGNPRKVRPPRFKSWRKPYSFTMSPSGYKFDDDKVRILGRNYRFNLSRPIQGNVKTVTVKCDALGDVYLTVVTDDVASEVAPKTGKAAGFDFGIKTMFTSSEGIAHESPEFYRQSQTNLANVQRALSSKKRGSGNRERARHDVARTHRKIRRQREDHHWHLAKHLVLTHDVLVFETLTFEGMKRLWGRKVSDIAPYAFHQKLKHQAKKHGKQVVYIDRWEPTSKTCSVCGQLNALMDLKTRRWQCQGCKSKHDRDVNAAINILRVGTSTLEVGDVRLAIASNRRRNNPVPRPYNPTRLCQIL